MAIHSNPNFPILESDQADVIQIFLELMSEADRTVRASKVTANRPILPRIPADDSRIPDELRGLE